MWADVAAIYRASKKKKDINWFTEWVCRPPAALLVYLLRNTRITPNQLTFGSLVLCACACAMFIFGPGRWWLIGGAAVYELSFILDCADGQLARVRAMASTVGHLLDFLMDEIKAFLVYAAVTVRLWHFSGDERYLLVGIGGLVAVASGIAMTSFMRRPEYGARPPTADGQPAQVGGRTGLIGIALNALEWAARLVVHYPQYIWLLAALDRLDIYLFAYGAVNVLHVGRSTLILLIRLGRFAPPP